MEMKVIVSVTISVEVISSLAVDYRVSMGSQVKVHLLWEHGHFEEWSSSWSFCCGSAELVSGWQGWGYLVLPFSTDVPFRGWKPVFQREEKTLNAVTLRQAETSDSSVVCFWSGERVIRGDNKCI